jgi:hypothetical protein
MSKRKCSPTCPWCTGNKLHRNARDISTLEIETETHEDDAVSEPCRKCKYYNELAGECNGNEAVCIG